MLYYTPPKQELFEEVKYKSMALWKIIDTDQDKFGYATEKINRIKDIENVADNFMFIVAMFDIKNQSILAQLLSPEAKLAIRERMVEGGQPKEYIFF